MVAEKSRLDSRVRPSQKHRRRKRRLSFAKRANEVRIRNLADGLSPGLFAAPDYHMLASCGWDVAKREMRLREPPTRACGPDGKGRINRRNVWHQAGDVQKLVAPVDAAAWLWWMSLTEDEQDEMYEMSAKVVGGDGLGIGHTDPDPLAMLTDEATRNKRLAVEGENFRDWGRKP